MYKMSFLACSLGVLIAFFWLGCSTNHLQKAEENIITQELESSAQWILDAPVKPITTSQTNHLNSKFEGVDLLATKPLKTINRKELKHALDINSEQLITYIINTPDITAFEARIILDVVYQFDDNYRLQVSEELITKNSTNYRMAGYQLLANSASEDDSLVDYISNVLADAIDVEEDPEVVSQLLTIIANQSSDLENNHRLKIRVKELISHEDFSIQSNAFNTLLRLQPTDETLPIIRANLYSDNPTLQFQTIDSLFLVNEPSARLIAEVSNLTNETDVADNVKQHASTLIKLWKVKISE